jgi:hypothetical protein
MPVWRSVGASYYYAPDFGYLVKIDNGWYGTRDSRAGDYPYFCTLLHQNQVLQPTVGPFKQFTDAKKAYEEAMMTKEERMSNEGITVSEPKDYPPACGGDVKLITEGKLHCTSTLTIRSGNGFKGATPGAIKFYIGERVIIELHEDRSIVMGEELAKDEEARGVWEALKVWLSAATCRMENNVSGIDPAKDPSGAVGERSAKRE